MIVQIKKIRSTMILLSLLVFTCSTNPKKSAPPIKSDEFSILCMGDLLVVKNAEEQLEVEGIDYPFVKIKKYLKNYDIVFANFEMSVTFRGNVHPTKPFTFRLHPDNAEYFKLLKIDVVSLANNHILDYGREGLFDTIEFLNEWGVSYSGAGENLAAARKPAIIKKKETEIIFLSYCERPPADFFATENSAGTAPLKLSLIREDIKKNKTAGNIVLISLHWGIEHNDYPESYQVKIAHEIIDAGADGIIGHHPHVPQGIEIYNGKPIIYSLGNAVTGFYNPYYKNNIMVAMIYNKNSLKRIKIIPIAGKYKEIKSQPYLLKGEDAMQKIDHIQRISRPFKTDIKKAENYGFIYINN